MLAGRSAHMHRTRPRTTVGAATSVPIGNANRPASPGRHNNTVNAPATVEGNGHELVRKEPKVGGEHRERMTGLSRRRVMKG